MDNFFNNINLLELLLKWKKQIIIVVSSAFVLSIIISSPIVITPRYKSFAVVYPSNLTSYSTETPTEQMLQIFHSNTIRDSIIKKHNLAEHYGIDTSEKFSKTYLNLQYNEFVHIDKSEFESVEITVIAYDPDTAQRIVFSIIDQFNQKVRALHREKLSEHLNALLHQMDNKQVQVDSLNKQLDTLRMNYDLLDYTIQAKEATKQYVKSSNKNSYSADILNNLQKKGGEFLLLSGSLTSTSSIYNQIRNSYEQAYADLTKDLTYSNIVIYPEVPEKKFYPIRWMIIFISTIASFILCIFAIATYESLSKTISETK